MQNYVTVDFLFLKLNVTVSTDQEFVYYTYIATPKLSSKPQRLQYEQNHTSTIIEIEIISS